MRGDLVAGALHVLDSVNNDASRWHIVYEPGALRVHFRTRAQGKLKTVELGRLDGSCARPVRMLDIDTEQAGDVTDRFQDYSDEANRRLVNATMHGVAEMPPQAIEAVARYPSRLACGVR